MTGNKEVFEQIGLALGRVGESVSSATCVFASVALEIVKISNKIKEYPNKRVIHLALHSRKKRVRAKEARRIARWCFEEVRR